MSPNISQILTKNKTKLSHWTVTWHVQTMVGMWRLVWYAINNIMAKQ